MIDDINDKEDESTISQWLKDHNYDKNKQFITIRNLITPTSYGKNTKSRKNSSDKIQINVKNDEEKKDEDGYGSDGAPPWAPRQVTITVEQQATQNEITELFGDNVNADNFNISQLMSILDNALNLDENPSLVQDIISQLSVELTPYLYILIFSFSVQGYPVMIS